MAGRDQVASHVLQNNHYLLCTVLETSELIPSAVTKGLLTNTEGDEIAQCTSKLGNGAGMAKFMELVLVRPSSFEVFLEILGEKEELKTWATYLRNDFEAEMTVLQEVMDTRSPSHTKLGPRDFNYSDPILNERSSQCTSPGNDMILPTFSSANLLADFKKAQGKSVETVDKLLKRYESQCIVRSVFDVDMKSLLHLACELMDFRVVRLLVDKYNFNPNDQDVAGNTALHIASKAGKSQTVVYLLGCPACDPNVRDREGRTAFHVASLGGRKSITRFFLKCERIDHAIVEEVKRISVGSYNPGKGNGSGPSASTNSGEVPGTFGGVLPGNSGRKKALTEVGGGTKPRPNNLKFGNKAGFSSLFSKGVLGSSPSVSGGSEAEDSPHGKTRHRPGTKDHKISPTRRTPTESPAQRGTAPTRKGSGGLIHATDRNALQLSNEESKSKKMSAYHSAGNLQSKNSEQLEFPTSTAERMHGNDSVPGLLPGSNSNSEHHDRLSQTSKNQNISSIEPHGSHNLERDGQESSGSKVHNGKDGKSLAFLYQQTNGQEQFSPAAVDSPVTQQISTGRPRPTSWQDSGNTENNSPDGIPEKPYVALTVESDTGDGGRGSCCCCCRCLGRRRQSYTTKPKHHTGSCCSFSLMQSLPSIFWLVLGIIIGVAVLVAVIVLLVIKEVEK